MYRFLSRLLVWLMFCPFAFAATAPDREFTLTPRKVTSAPRLDGILDDISWVAAEPLSGFTQTGENTAADVQTRVYTVYDDEALYVAFDCDEPNPAGLKMDAATIKEVWQKQNDLVDLFLVPEKGEMYQFAVTPAGFKFDRYYGDKPGLTYNYGKDCPVAIKIGETNWVCEMKLPFTALRIEPQMGRTWRVNFTRWRSQSKLTKSSWAKTSGLWKSVGSYGTMAGLIIGGTTMGERPPLKLEGVTIDSSSFGENLVTVRLKARRSAAGKYMVRTSALSPAGREQENSSVVEVKKRGVAEYEVPYRLAMESGKHQLTLTLADAPGEDVFYRSPPCAIPIPSFLHVYCDRNYYTTEEQCWIHVQMPTAMAGVIEGTTLEVILKDPADDTVLRTEKKSNPALAERVNVPISGLEPGRYRVEVTLRGKGGDTVSSFGITITKHPPHPNEVKMDRVREIFLVNGKPFLPLGWWLYSGIHPDEALRELKEYGFNYVTVSAYQFQGVDKVRNLLDLAHKHGIKVGLITDSFQTTYREHWWHFDRGLMGRRLKLKNIPLTVDEWYEMCLRTFEEGLPQIKDHPALFGFIMGDEPGGSEKEKWGFERIMQTARKHDPYHPLWTDFASGHIKIEPSDYRDYDKYFDFPAFNRYWRPIVNGPGSIGVIGDALDTAADVSRDWHVPKRIIVQASKFSGALREISAYEHRVQRYLGLIHGAKGGIIYWRYNEVGVPTHGDAWKEMKRLNQESKRLFPIIAEPGPEDVEIRALSAGSPIRLLLKIYQGKIYLLVANISTVSQEVTIEGNFIAPGTRVREFFKNTEVACADGKIGDSMRYQDTRVYEVTGWQPAPEEKFVLHVTSRSLPERLDVKQVFASNPGAMYFAGISSIRLGGKGNTLESIARDIGNEEIFSYDKQSRTAVTTAEAIRIGFGGDLTIGGEDPAESETLEFKTASKGITSEGTLRILNSSLTGKVGGIDTYRIGKVVIVRSKIGDLTPRGHTAKEPEISSTGEVTATYYGLSTKPSDDRLGRRYSKRIRDFVDLPWEPEGN